MNSLQQRSVAIVLIAIIPAILFLLSRQAYILVLSWVSTVIIAASLYYMFTSTDEEIGWAKPL
jgi:Ca2+/Na+ antiporter